MTDNTIYHIPALLPETLDALHTIPDGVYADATFGGGGHSRAILQTLGENGRLYGFDQDEDAIANSIPDPRFRFVRGNFRYMENFLRYFGEEKIDGIIADLGVSFHHFDDARRGFSFRTDAPLDMRMNRQSSVSAATVVNEYSRDDLASIFALYTDLKRPGAYADAIIKARGNSGISTTGELCSALAGTVNPRQEKKDLAQAFQALRIEVNGEMDALREFLESTKRILRPGGRLAILTYHSIEDRIVKNFMRSGNVEGKLEKDFFGRSLSPWKAVTKGAIAPSAAEVESNPRSRSAKLRAVELLPAENV